MPKLSQMLTEVRSYRQVAIMLTGLAVLSSAGCASGMAATATGTRAGTVSVEKHQLTIAAVPTASSAGLYVAQQEGFFRQAGLDVKIVSIGSGADVTSNLLNGSIDVVNGAYAGFIEAQAHGAGKFHVLADGYAGAPHVDEIVVPPKSKITSVSQLKGATIAVNALASVASLLVTSTLESQGVQPSQVHLVAMPFPAMPGALKAHKVDAAYLVEPYLSQTEAQIGGEELIDVNQGATQDFPINGYVATQAWCQKYPQTAAAVAKALDRGQAIADTNRPEVERALTHFTSINRQIAAIMSLGNFPTSVDTVHLQRVADLMFSNGQLKKHFNMAAMTSAVGG
jgi:NitT/TauT family transport system substrate-binding protein